MSDGVLWEFWDAARWSPDEGWRTADWAHTPLDDETDEL